MSPDSLTSLTTRAVAPAALPPALAVPPGSGATADAEGARRIAASIYRELRDEHGWGKAFPPDLEADALDRLARLKPREMRRVMLAAFGNAKLAGRHEVLADDITDERCARKARIGF